MMKLLSVRPDVVVERICCSEIYHFGGLAKKVLQRSFRKMEQKASVSGHAAEWTRDERVSGLLGLRSSQRRPTTA